MEYSTVFSDTFLLLAFLVYMVIFIDNLYVSTLKSFLIRICVDWEFKWLLVWYEYPVSRLNRSNSTETKISKTSQQIIWPLFSCS